MKNILIISFLLLIGGYGFGQAESEDLNLYQDILNHKEFIKIIESDTSYLCNGTLYYKSDLIDLDNKLKFKGKELLSFNKENKNQCFVLSFPKPKPKGRFSLIIALENNKTDKIIGKCLQSNFVRFECRIKKTKTGYKIIKTETTHWHSSALLL